MGSMAGVTAFLLLILAVAPAYATDYMVGDTSGWTSGSDYTTWASDKTFKVGDSLLFSYSMLHSVSEVSKSDYDACSAANSLQTYSDGSTTINLTAPGTRYFICGTVGHCSSGMKLAVNVASGSGSTDSPPPSTGSGSTDSPPPSTGSGSTDAPPPSTGSGSTDAPPPSTGSDSTDSPPSAGSGSTDTPSTGSGSGSGSDDSPSAGSGSGDAPAAGSGNDSPSSTTPATTPGSSASNVPSTHSTTTPSGKTTPTTSVNAAAGSGFSAAGGVMAGLTTLVVGVVALMG
ncbi:putative blue copper protein [Iris pallida]|uniref:Blue copper protein n=1 Tax=Iris pallida TaxID=29817 RepID=A0AAX6DW55_IRIPA|nr:putative blue copper protein [Iris pallida]KAJ6853490.1 putative blue copper protein [Iris pallida]